MCNRKNSAAFCLKNLPKWYYNVHFLLQYDLWNQQCIFEIDPCSSSPLILTSIIVYRIKTLLFIYTFLNGQLVCLQIYKQFCSGYSCVCLLVPKLLFFKTNS